MANIKSSKKNIKKSFLQNKKNKKIKNILKKLKKQVTLIKENNHNIENMKNISNVVSYYVSCLDKANKKNIIHSNKANRHKKNVLKWFFNNKEKDLKLEKV